MDSKILSNNNTNTNRIRVSISVDKYFWSNVKKCSKSMGITVSALVSVALNHYLANNSCFFMEKEGSNRDK